MIPDQLPQYISDSGLAWPKTTVNHLHTCHNRKSGFLFVLFEIGYHVACAALKVPV